jgi:hypothetical protein
MQPWPLVALLLLGCDARFVDLRGMPESALFGSAFDPRADLAGVDLIGIEKLLAQGNFSGRGGHAATGTAELYRRADAVIEVRFGADFQSSSVPGPAVFLTSRDAMGGTIEPQTDINLGVLAAPQGAQAYAVPFGADLGRRNVFVYCQPYRVEVAKATLVDVP